MCTRRNVLPFASGSRTQAQGVKRGAVRSCPRGRGVTEFLHVWPPGHLPVTVMLAEDADSQT